MEEQKLPKPDTQIVKLDGIPYNNPPKLIESIDKFKDELNKYS
jgi:hypothetical protein